MDFFKSPAQKEDIIIIKMSSKFPNLKVKMEWSPLVNLCFGVYRIPGQ